jgi:hypothetical protein
MRVVPQLILVTFTRVLLKPIVKPLQVKLMRGVLVTMLRIMSAIKTQPLPDVIRRGSNLIN